MIEIGNIKREIQQRKDRKAKAKEEFLEKRAKKMNGWLYHIKTFLGKDFKATIDDRDSTSPRDINIGIYDTDYRAILRFYDTGIQFLPSRLGIESKNWVKTNKEVIEAQIECNVKEFMEWRMR